MICVNEHDLSLPDSIKDTPLAILSNTFCYESSSLLMKSSPYDNVSNNIYMISLFIRSI